MPLKQPSQLQPLTLPQVLIAPFRALILGHIFFVSYITFGAALLWHLLIQTQRLFHELIISTDLHRFFPSVSSVETIFALALWSLLIPVTISLIAVPIRAIWLHHRMGLKDLAKWTFPAFRKTAHALLTSAKALILILTPLIAILVVHKMLRENHLLPVVGGLFYALGAIVALIVIFRGIGVLFSVLISVCTGVHPEVGLVISNEMLKTKLLHLMVIALVGVSVVLISHFGSPYLSINSNPSHKVELYLLAFTIWYSLSSLCVLALEASEEYVRRFGRTFRPELMADSSRGVASQYGASDL